MEERGREMGQERTGKMEKHRKVLCRAEDHIKHFKGK